ncbi:hypothetical protein SAMN05878482_106100 [Peribacillus simplex]|uniref:Uncharacterized protein n=1 Tax=Peribacillus simplex TaxID=1478 RepID=A0A9X8RBY4_9BACI|nr:hypothetical protein SAMN05878482_106100 [Peribacillus simplex]
MVSFRTMIKTRSLISSPGTRFLRAVRGPPQTRFICFFYELLIGLKKYATLLPNNWLAETPQALEPRRLGRQSAERERISENDWNVF